MRRTALAERDPQVVNHIATVLHRLTHLDTSSLETLESLVRRSAMVELESGEYLIREGDTSAPEFFMLVQGSLLVRSRGRRINRAHQAGEILGELAVLQAPPRSADVVAESAAQLLAIRPDTLRLPEFAGIAASFYMMLSCSLAKKLRAMTTQSRERFDEIEREAATDKLTGLANRKRLDEFLGELVSAAARSGQPSSLIMADVDHFKHYNDTNGHPKGDIVLAKVGVILQSHIRRGDLAARYGGEEFVIVLPNCDAKNAAKTADKVRASIERESFPNEESQPGGQLTATLGVATARSADGIDDLIRRADAALYRGKAAGRNTVMAAP